MLISSRNRRSRCGKKSHDKVHSLLCPSLLGARPSSLGYHSESPGEGETSNGESEALEYAEDYAVLEDEGVTRLSRGKFTFHKVGGMFTFTVSCNTLYGLVPQPFHSPTNTVILCSYHPLHSVSESEKYDNQILLYDFCYIMFAS